MIEFLRDQIWQFVGAFLGLLALVASYLFYRVQKQRKALECAVVSRASVASVNDEFEGKIQVLYEGTPIQDAHLVVISIRNSGNIQIISADFERPLTFSFGDGSQVMSVGIVEEIPEGIRANTRVEGGRVVLEPLLLNSGDTLVIKVFVNNLITVLVDGRVAGIPTIDTRDQPAQPGNRGSFRSRTTRLITSILVGIIVVELLWVSTQIPIEMVLIGMFAFVGIGFAVVAYTVLGSRR